MTKYQLRDGWHYYNYIILTCVLLVLPCPFLLIIYSPEKREEECERDCNHFFIANNILWKATNWRPIYHKTTQHYLLLSISLSEYWKMTFSLSLSLSLSGWVRLFWFLLLHVSGQFNIFGDQTWNLHFAVEGLFSSWLFFGLLRFIIYDYIGVLFFPFQLYLFIYGKVLYGRLSS